jgi:hypothetical protein
LFESTQNFDVRRKSTRAQSFAIDSISTDLGQRLIVSDRGILIVHLECDEKMNILILINVLFVSDLKINLISIIKLAKSEVEFWMRVDKLTKIYYRDNLIDQALIKKSQYIIQIIENRDITALTLIDEKSARLWHERMRHLKYRNLIKLFSQIVRIKDKISSLSEICDDCMKDRQQKKSSYISMMRVNQKLKLIYSDLSDSLSITRRDERYLMIIKNDYIEIQ